MSVGNGIPSSAAPRISSEEVAEDYKNSLEDLALNSRYEISNLTIIAKENTEHAMAISRVLENHIRNVSSLGNSRAQRADGSFGLYMSNAFGVSLDGRC